MIRGSASSRQYYVAVSAMYTTKSEIYCWIDPAEAGFSVRRSNWVARSRVPIICDNAFHFFIILISIFLKKWRYVFFDKK